MALARRVREASPGSPVVLMTADASLPAADGVARVEPDLVGFELAGLIRRLRPGAPSTLPAEPPPLVSSRRRRAPPGRAEIFLVLAGKGGVGKSVTACNLAVALRQDSGRRVALLDLDLQFGDVALMLGVGEHRPSIETLAHHGELVDDELLRGAMVPGPEGVEALLAPPSPELAELVTPGSLRAILRVMGRWHDHIVVDGPAHLDDQTLEVIELADHIVVVTSFSVTAVKDTRILLTVLHAMGVDRHRISLVLNQTRARTTLLPEEIEERLRGRIRTRLPFEHEVVDDSIDAGIPFVISRPDSEISRRIHSLARFLAATDGVEERSPAGRHPFRRRFWLGRRAAGA